MIHVETLIGLMGKKGAGKDSVANILVKKHGFTRYAFADKLKEVLLEVNPLVYYRDPGDDDTLGGVIRLKEYIDLWGWDTAKKDIEVRRLMQEFGTRLHSVKRDLWSEYVLHNLKGPLVVVTDVRFIQEYTGLASFRGNSVSKHFVRVIRDMEQSDTHVSETELDGIPATRILRNTGTLEDLEILVDDLVETL